ncbi:MAG: T9SS type A sorting domain-containing protein [Bacteroidales bacterium]|nr:T9SS type A sorting domain-containing protein [Bacteroidales bacterium]
MNKILRYFLIMLAIMLIAPVAKGQYTTPGNNLSLTLDDLVTLSGGVVTTSDGDYFVNNTVIISATDTLKILQPETIRVAATIRIEISGKFISDPVDGQVIFTAQDTTVTAGNFRGFRFDDADDAIFRNTVVKYGGGIQLIGTEALFEYCVIRNNGSSNVSGAINYSGCSPVIRYCEFRENARAAIASGANVTGSPQIMYNSFIHNTMDNSNRPQINIGPGASDTIYIVGNYIEGLNDNAGGIGLSNLLGGANTLALIAENVIVGNRYGYAQTGNNISSMIRDNIILDNDIQGNPMLGGSGLNFLGNTNNFSVVRNNIISGNLWGVTIQNTALPEFGTVDDHGGNVFFDNGNNGQTYALYNNTPNPISAIGNYWGSNDAETVESYIFHQPDDGSLGLVTYDPFMTLHPEILSFNFSQALNPGLDDDYEGVIDGENFTIHFMFPEGTDVSALIPDITIPFGAEITPDTGEPQDFTLPVVYTVSVPHGDEQEWTVTVEVESPPSGFTVNFIVLNEDGNELTDAVITLDGEANDAGDYVFEEVMPGTYEYTVSLFGYHTAAGIIEITDEDIIETVVMELITYTLTFVITAEDGWEIPDAVIILNGSQNDFGVYVFEDLLPGVYEYSIYAYGFLGVDSVVEITDADVELHVELEYEVSVHEYTTGQLNIYPNPAASYFMLNIENEEQAELLLNDLTGRTVFRKTIENSLERIDVGHLPNGIYVVTLQAGNKSHVGKLHIIR